MAKKKIQAANVARIAKEFEASRQTILTGNRAERYMAEKKAKANILQSVLNELALERAMYEHDLLQAKLDAVQATGPAL